MKLYHGTNIDFFEIDFKKCKPNKDFGCGFYLTDIKQQAVDMAIRRAKFEDKGSPVVQEYEFDESLLTSDEFGLKSLTEYPTTGHNLLLLIEMQKAREYTITMLWLVLLLTMELFFKSICL